MQGLHESWQPCFWLLDLGVLFCITVAGKRFFFFDWKVKHHLALTFSSDRSFQFYTWLLFIMSRFLLWKKNMSVITFYHTEWLRAQLSLNFVKCENISIYTHRHDRSTIYKGFYRVAVRTFGKVLTCTATSMVSLWSNAPGGTAGWCGK